MGNINYTVIDAGVNTDILTLSKTASGQRNANSNFKL